MADADWAQYKQIRGKALPETIKFQGATYSLAKVFKRDFYAATGLYQRSENGEGSAAPDKVVFKHYHMDPLWFIPLRWLGRLLWRREMQLGKAVGDVAGVAHILGRFGKSGLVREYIPGQNLREYLVEHDVDAQFFVKLRQSLADVHACGIAHNDLNKPENILVREDGSPVLIDFQIAYKPPQKFPGLKQVGRVVLRYLQQMDWYHLLKHHHRRRPQDFTKEDLEISTRRGILLNLHAWLLRRPYRVIRHLVMRSFLMADKTAR
jgi:serine/threonine protein kinase